MAAHAFAFTYLPRRTMHSLIEDLQEDGLRVQWKDSIAHDGFSIQRFATAETSGRETHCVGFSRNSPDQNGRPKHHLYGFVYMPGRGQLEDRSVIEFGNAVRD